MNTHSGRRMTKQNIGYADRRYIEGNTVRKLDTVKEMQQQPRKVNKAVRKNRDRALYMNLPYVIFLSVALMITGVMLIGYLQTQAELTVSMKRIATLESQLNDMRLNNDEQLERINSSIDMEEIKRIAVEELGMAYAKEGQVIVVSGEGSDYVRQLVKMPD